MSAAVATTVASGIVEGIKIVDKVAKKIHDTKETLKEQSKTNIDSTFVDGAIADGDFIRIIKATLIEPTIIVTNNTIYNEIIDQINNVILDNISAYYIQIFDMLTRVGGKSSLEAIDLLSTNLYNYDTVINTAKKLAKKQIISQAINASKVEKENFKLGLESLNFDSVVTFMSDNEMKQCVCDIKEIVSESAGGPETFKQSSDVRQNLLNVFFNPKDGSLAKILTRKFNVTICIPTANGTFYVSIPIIARANIKVIDIEDLVPVIGSKDAKNTFLARFHEWRSGAISLWNLITCGDMIKKLKEGKLNKNNKLLTDIENQNTATYIRQMITGSKGFEAMYTSLVLTSDEINYLSKIATVSNGSLDLHGTGTVDLESNKGKDFLLNALNGFILTVIDTERVRMYMKGINGCLDVGHKVFKRRDNGNNDMLDFFKAISSGSSIRF